MTDSPSSMPVTPTETKFTASDDRAMRRKISDLMTATRTRYAIYPTLCTTYGLAGYMYAGTIHSVVTCDDLFA